MHASGRYLYVLFCCQHAVEKMLKATIVERSDEPPPRLHSLPRLAQLCALNLDDAQLDVLARLSAFYFQTRYPEEIDAASANISPQQAQTGLTDTEAILKWLQSMLK